MPAGLQQALPLSSGDGVLKAPAVVRMLYR